MIYVPSNFVLVVVVLFAVLHEFACIKKPQLLFVVADNKLELLTLLCQQSQHLCQQRCVCLLFLGHLVQFR